MRINYICETCGKSGSRVYAQNSLPSHFFCSRECQNEWQKTREDIVLKNKDPKFRKKVSEALKRRKIELGKNYHSSETKQKIGEATSKRWEEYDSETKARLLQVLRNNATAMRTYGPYDWRWHLLSAKLRKNGICHRCGSRENLTLHHIIPVKQGGTSALNNLAVLCKGCHTTVEALQKKVFEIIPDWEIVRILVRERLHYI